MTEIKTERDFIFWQVKTHFCLCLGGVALISSFALIMSLPFGGLDFVIGTIESIKAPVVKKEAIVTSKELDDRYLSPKPTLAIKNDYLNGGGAFVHVSEGQYSATSVGDTVCVKYQRVTGNQQYGLHFVNQGRCN